MTQFFFGPYEPAFGTGGLRRSASIADNIHQIAGKDMRKHPIVLSAIADVEKSLGKNLTQFMENKPSARQEWLYERFFYTICGATALAIEQETQSRISRVAACSSGLFSALQVVGYFQPGESIVRLRYTQKRFLRRANRVFRRGKFFGAFVELPPGSDFDMRSLSNGKDLAERVAIKDRRGETSYLIAGRHNALVQGREQLNSLVPDAKFGVIFKTYPSHTEHLSYPASSRKLRAFSPHRARIPLVTGDGSEWPLDIGAPDQLEDLLYRGLAAPMDTLAVFDQLLKSNEPIFAIGGTQTRLILKSVRRARPQLASVVCI